MRGVSVAADQVRAIRTLGEFALATFLVNALGGLAALVLGLTPRIAGTGLFRWWLMAAPLLLAGSAMLALGAAVATRDRRLGGTTFVAVAVFALAVVLVLTRGHS
jgi:hypothetical protein